MRQHVMVGNDDIRAAREAPASLGIMHGGPFFRWQAAIGLVTQTTFRSALRCGLLLAVTWILPVLVLGASGLDQLWSFLKDPGVWAKFLIAPTLFILAEPQIERTLDRCADLIFKIPIVAAPLPGKVNAALHTVEEQKSSAAAEAICVLLATVLSLLNIWALVDAPGAHWAASGGGLTWAGWLCLVVGNTLVWFLLLRLIWRHVIWTRFLNAIATADLRLVASHPDGHAGLSFIGLYINGYVFFSLGVGAIVAAGLVKQLQRQALSLTAFSAVCTLWLVVVVLYFTLPLVRPIAQILRLKSTTIALALAPILIFERTAEQKSLGRNAFSKDPVSDQAAVTDARPVYQAAVKCSAMLLNKGNVVPILAAALLPIAAAGLTAFPFSELGPVLKRLLLF